MPVWSRIRLADVVPGLRPRNGRQGAHVGTDRNLLCQVLSRNLFKQSIASREAVGIFLIALGVVLLLNA